jgi:hypothetical protein
MIYLSAQVDHVGIGVVEGKHDAVGSIQLDHDDRIVEMIGRPQRVLAFRHFRESGGEDQSVAQVNGPCGFGTFVANGFFIHGTRARIDDADLFVFAGGEQFSSVPAPACRIHQIRMGVDHYGRLAGSNVPDYHQVIRACGGFRELITIKQSFNSARTGCHEDVLSRRMPQDQTDSALMVQQLNDRFRQGPDVFEYANQLINFN